MSTYENYSLTSQHYDKTRSAQGAEIWIGALSGLDQPSDEIRLLDAGCGTGNYALALAPHVGHLTAVDLNKNMLAMARSKLAPFVNKNRARLVRGSLTALPFPEAEFDAVMINQVLHHLDDDDEKCYPNLRRAIEQIERVLKPGGLLLLNACSRRQILHGFWYYALIPSVRDAYVRRIVPTAKLRSMLPELGLAAKHRIAFLEPLTRTDAYFDPRGPLDPEWRSGDSIWAAASRKEIAAAEEKIRDLGQQGCLENYLHEQDRERTHIGQTTFWVIEKPNGS